MALPKMAPAELERGSSANDCPGRSPTGDTHDAHVTRAKGAMRTEPTRRWTVAELARVAGLSRAAFARRFKNEAGVSPLRWLAQHRLRHAAEALRETDLSLAALAAEIGYQCEFAFAKAFKRLFGIAPGMFRRMARTSVPAFRAAA